jgi:hypothetical protein
MRYLALACDYDGTLDHHDRVSDATLAALDRFAATGRTLLQIADGVDDRTWEHRQRPGDYSRWFREKVKDADLARDAEAIERRTDLSPAVSRGLIAAAVEKRYTLPEKSPGEAEGLATGRPPVRAHRPRSFRFADPSLTSGRRD